MKMMNRTWVAGIALGLALLAPAADGVRATGPASNVVLQWNRALQDSFPSQGVGTVRPFSMTHIAMFDAVNAIERDYEPFRVRPRSSDGGSAEAAAAQAAHDVLVGLNPTAAATYDALLASQLGARPSGFVRRGAAVGARVAKEILAWRQNDGWVLSSPAPPFTLPALPGLWQPTPPANAAAAFGHLQFAAPMALVSATQFLPPPPPVLTSERYAADFNEVKLLGKSDSATRSPEQTRIARSWAGVGEGGTQGSSATNFLSVLNNIVGHVATERGLSIVQTARLFVLVNVSVHDALQTTQTSKFVYGVWRPVTAIRQADTDLNPATDADAEWLPLIMTPPYPSYAGNIVTIGSSAMRALQLALGSDGIGKDIPVTWKRSNAADYTQMFSTFSEVAEQMYMARIWSGIHFRFDQDAGQQVGRSTAEYVFANYMQRRTSHWGDWFD
jgi:hypothetical protein